MATVTVTAPAGCNAYEEEPRLHEVPDHINAIGYTHERWLNEYTLMCGYQETLDINGFWLRLYGEHGSYHVRCHDFNSNQRVLWETFETVDEARVCFAVKAKELYNKNGEK